MPFAESTLEEFWGLGAAVALVVCYILTLYQSKSYNMLWCNIYYNNTQATLAQEILTTFSPWEHDAM